MTKTTFATLAEQRKAADAWYLVDASKHVLGRMATRIAQVLMGKHSALYTPHLCVGNSVVVINASRVGLTGNKGESRIYTRYSGFPGGLKELSLNERVENEPERLIKEAVRRMLPKNRIGKEMLARLKVYSGSEHPHAAQKPETLTID